MKITPRYFPIIILAVFVLFVLIGLALGFRPQRGENRHSGYYPAAFSAQHVLKAS